MDFKLTEEQELIKSNIREFVLQYVEPAAAEIDANCRQPVEIFEKLGELGMMGISYPAEYGGGGEKFVTTMMVKEELARACGTPGFLHPTAMASSDIPYSLSAMKSRKNNTCQVWLKARSWVLLH